MMLQKRKFEFVDRGKDRNIVLLPGWASDYRVFKVLDINFNYLLPINFYPDSFEESLLDYVKDSNLKNISLLGWSMGGFIAAGLAGKYPNLVDELILVSIRKKYPDKNITQIKKLLKRNKRAYIKSFYKQCFYTKENFSWFKENLLNKYCEFDLGYLLDTLDYLGNSELNPDSLKSIKKIKIIHGQYDNIASEEEALDIKSQLSQAEFICLKDIGHLPFLSKEFKL